LLAVASIQTSFANEFDLPNLGTPSDSILSPIKEKEIRDDIINQIYQYNLVMSDPLIADYIEQLGYRLAVNSENPSAPFDFFMVNDNIVNASAYPGGLIVIYSGLFLRTQSESELAGVVAHEIAHATQRHVSRAFANAKKNTIPTLLGMLGAVLVSQYSDSRDAPVAIVTAASAMQQQSMINFTRSHEKEADRVGISTLKKSNFDPKGMADFFELLMRETPTDERYQMPEYNRTHPLSINRVTEAKNRAGETNPEDIKESELYPFIKERIRIFTKNIEIDNVSYYRKLFHDTTKDKITQAQIYGYALALYHANENKAALKTIQSIKTTDFTQLLVAILKANIHAELNWEIGKKKFEKLYDFYPESPIVIEPYIQMLIKSTNIKYRLQARNLARKLVQIYPENANYYQLLATINQNAGKSIEANEALAMKEHIINNNYRAVRILKNILKGELDYYQRARIEAKITKFEGLITDKERSLEIQQERTGGRH